MTLTVTELLAIEEPIIRGWIAEQIGENAASNDPGDQFEFEFTNLAHGDTLYYDGTSYEWKNTTQLQIDPDTNTVTVSDGKLYIDDGNAVAAALLTTDYSILSAQGSPAGFSIVVASSGDPQDRGVFKGTRARNTLASPTVPNSGDTVLSILGAIYDGVDTEGTAAVDFLVDGAVSSNVAPQRISFKTSTTTALNRVERLIIKSNGDIIIGASSASGQLHVDQISATGAQPVLFLDQGDASEQAIIISYNGADVDMILVELDVTGSPQITWDESEDIFTSNKGWDITGPVTVTGDVDITGYLGLRSSNELRFYDNGNYVGFEAPALAADQIWVLPDADGNASDFLQTDGAGNLTWAVGGGGGGAPVDAQYVTLAVDATLTVERVLTGTANQITVTDNGAGGTVVLSTPQNIHTAATPTFGGVIIANGGTVGQAAGPLMTFDDTNNKLHLTTCAAVTILDTGTESSLGVGTATPTDYRSYGFSVIEANGAAGSAFIMAAGATNGAQFYYDSNGIIFSNKTGSAASKLKFSSGASPGTGLGQLTIWTSGHASFLNRLSVGINAESHLAQLYVDQSYGNHAIPVLTLAQADVDMEFIKFIGASADGVADRSLVDAADMTTPGALVGWYQIYIEDVQGTNPIPDGVYYQAFYAAPSA